MQILKKTLIIILALYLAILLFMPKEAFYYALEKELVKYDIKLNEVSIKERLFSLEIKNISGYVKGINLISIDKITFFTLLFFTKIEIDNIQIDESIGKMLPQAIDYIKIKHSILSPLFVDVNAKGTFGEAIAKINILKRRVHIDINDTSSLPMLKPWLKKGDKGWFYEKSF